MVTEPNVRPPSDWRDLQVGARVVVRRRLRPEEQAEGAPQRWTDVVGVVVALDGAGLDVRPDRRPGLEVVHVAAADVEVVKPVPPRPARRGERH
ncbi:hypothetical protein LEP48_03370 [Isoptericola sp. NEAU-Y5]|uniref:Ferrous iron transport protein A n=1 Tax=Isoptericola luteus TaxID=2879484 RepID=A0ABS7ZD55_9MICO|nr:DUF6725 family protein [Isoptericola sp. NEAU-Y5]MCA5892392.1 hypothetical protein [Isoptericola sp. NEAU-Y5]